MHGLLADPPRVRFANPADEDDLMVLVRDLHTESGLRDADDRPLPLCEGKVRGLMQRAFMGGGERIARPREDARMDRSRVPDRSLRSAAPPTPNPGSAAIGVIDTSGRIEGSVFLSVESTWYSERPVLVEIWNYVAKPYRRSSNAKTLIAFSKAVAAVAGLPLVMAVMSTERQPAKMRFYERNLGCRPFGAFYLYNPDPLPDPLPLAGPTAVSGA